MTHNKTIYGVISLIIVLTFGLTSYLNNGEVKAEECSNPNLTEKQQCWITTIDKTLSRNKIESGFDLVEKWYGDSDFRSDCHAFTHKIGEAAYKIYSQNKALGLNSKTSYCGYGFFHGFIETLLAATNNPEEAQKFCESASKQLINETRKTSIACYHGIGHGAVDGSDPRAWGNPAKIIAPGIALCEMISNEDAKIGLCGTGVFNSLAIAYNEGKYGLKNDRNDPYAICKTQDKPYFEDACYEEMNTTAMASVNGDFAKAVKFTEKIASDHLAAVAIRNLSPVAVGIASITRNYGKEIDVCQSLQKRLIKDCILGMAMGALEVGTPGMEYVDALSICRHKALSVENSTTCFSALVSSSEMLYSKEVFKKICDMITFSEHQTCNNKQ